MTASEKRNRRKHSFKHGNNAATRTRRTKSIYKASNETQSTITRRKSPRLFQKTTQCQPERDERHEYFITNCGKIEDLFHIGYTEHGKQSPTCKGKLQLNKIEQRIISGKWCLQCPLCAYISQPLKLYHEVPTSN